MLDRPLLIAISGRLRKIRAAKGLTQAEIAELCGASPQMISNVERCKNWLSVPQLYALARGLEIPVSYFFQDVEPSGVKRTRLHEIADQMAPHELQAGIDILETILGMRAKMPPN